MLPGVHALAGDRPSEGNRRKPVQGLSPSLACPGSPIPTAEEQPWTRSLPSPWPWPRSLLTVPLFSRLVPESKLHVTSLPTSTGSYSALFLDLSAGALRAGCLHPSACHAWAGRSRCLSGLACPPWGHAESVPVVSYSFNHTQKNKYIF